MSSISAARLEWEDWLEARFAGYLLQDAAGARRDPEQVARALEHLYRSTSAWATLAELGFLLDPETGAAPLVFHGVPAWLRRALPTTVRHTEKARGRPRGRTEWSRTLRARLQSRDRTLFVGHMPERTFQTPAAVVIRWLLEKVVRVIEALPAHSGARGWHATLALLHTNASEAISHSALRRIAPRRPEAWERQQCAQDHDPVVRQAAAVLAFHDRLLPRPDPDALAQTVERFALAPTSRSRRFELFTLLALCESLDRLLVGWRRSDELVLANRDAISRWEGRGARVRVYYDQGLPPGRHAKVLQRVFGISAGFRPDIRIVYEDEAGSRELYVDPKCSTRDAYLIHSHAKMLAYVADRPSAFGPQGPKVILVTPRRVRAPWREGEPVAFLDPPGCLGAHFDRLLRAWLFPT